MIEDRLKICCSVNSKCEVIFERTLNAAILYNGKNVKIEEILQLDCYQIPRQHKQEILLARLNALTTHHRRNCPAYDRLLTAHGIPQDPVTDLHDFFPLPVRLFKEYELKSCPPEDIIKTMTSSGTTGQAVSRIFLDRHTAGFQSRALVKIIQNYLGKQRLPMLIVDTSAIIKNRKLFSARSAGILGFSTFGRDHTYLLDEEMQIDCAALEDFIARHNKEQIFVFGFTFMIWEYLYKPLLEAGKTINLENGMLIHSGGWKKMVQQAVDNQAYAKALKQQTGLGHIYNFYGMVEQVGSIFMECEQGHLHAPTFADVIIRNPFSLLPAKPGEEGVVQVLSILPHSYPGHSLLTEDIGVLHGEDDCPCGKKGKYFSIKGRIPTAELRGCSDTHAFNRK